MTAGRDSSHSDASATTYPSTLSSLSLSMLGLTDSPIAPTKDTLHMAGPYPIAKSPSGKPRPAGLRPLGRLETRRQRSQSNLRNSAFMASMHAIPETQATDLIHSSSATDKKGESRKIVKKPSNLSPSRPIGDVPARPERAHSSSTLVKQISKNETPVRQSSAPHGVDISAGRQARALRNDTHDPRANSPAILRAPMTQPLTSAEPKITRDVSGVRQNDLLEVVVPSRSRSPNLGERADASRHPPRPAIVHPPSSPARTEDTMAQDWETELAQDAARLNTGALRRPTKTQKTLANEQIIEARKREEQRTKDLAWERSGMWENQRDSAREAEDWARRDAGRAIAYPPTIPRVPIRAAPGGVTAVHIGVRPRLHPSRADGSVQSNQPDASLPIPRVSPLQSPLASNSQNDSGPLVRHDHDLRVSSVLAEKAKEEYEAWLSRKSEREGGVGEEEDMFRTGAWKPKNRQEARPGQVEGIAHSNGYGDASLKPPEHRAQVIEPPVENQHPWSTYGYPMQIQQPFPMMGYPGGDEGIIPYFPWYGQYPQMWDPDLWCGQMPFEGWAENEGLGELDQDCQQTGKQTKVHFAESPDKAKRTSSKSEFTEQPSTEQHLAEQQEALFGGQMAYDP